MPRKKSYKRAITEEQIKRGKEITEEIMKDPKQVKELEQTMAELNRGEVIKRTKIKPTILQAALPPEADFVNPKKYPENSPEWIVAKFLIAWKEKNWKEMFEYCQLSWKIRVPMPERIIQAHFNPKVLSAEIIKSEKLNEVVYVVTVEIGYRILLKQFVNKKETFDIRLIREDRKRLVPSPEGEWGININTIPLK